MVDRVVWPDPVLLADEGLGNSSYLLDLGDGSALVVDVSRDLRAVTEAALRRGLRIRFAVDTHLHADFLSGGLQLAAQAGSELVTGDFEVVASAAGRRRWPHRGLTDGDEVDLGGLRLRAVATPGHTDEHLALVVRDGHRSVGVFTGGSLIVGSVARTDLVAPERTEELARAQYRSVHRLLQLPDEIAVWPTHGAGSFCSSPAGTARTSTIGTEKATNALLRSGDEDGFVAALLGSLGSYPAYFDRLAEHNRRGPAVIDQPRRLAGLTVGQVRQAVEAGAVVVDVRPAADFADGYVPDAVSIPLRPAFASWLGWVVPDDRPIIVVRNTDQDIDEVVWQSAKIGYDHLVGELAGGMTSWSVAGEPTSTVRLAEPTELDGRRVIDVRQRAEYATGHVPGATHLELGTLRELDSGQGADLDGAMVMCGHGERAMTAASLLQSAGADDVSVLVGGPADWSTATGADLATVADSP